MSALAFAIGMSTVSTRADLVLDSTFGPGDGFNTTSGYAIRGAAVGSYYGEGFAFDAIATGYLTRLDVGLAEAAGASSARFALYASTGSHQIGGLLATFAAISPTGLAGSIYSSTSTLQPRLQAGSQYWLVAEPTSPSSFVTWNLSGTAGVAGSASSAPYALDDGSSVAYSSSLAPAFRLIGSTDGPVPAAVPEPSSLMLASIGVALIVALRAWKRLRQARLVPVEG